MFRDELNRIKENIKKGIMYRDIDERYNRGVWDFSIEYAKKHHLNDYYGLKEQDIGLITNILYDFIYDLLDEELNNETI